MVTRYRFTGRDLDATGALTPEALRDLARHLWDHPGDEPVVIDLGPVRQLQQLLVRDLSLYRCALVVRFEARDWRTRRDHTRALSRAIVVPA